MSYLWEDIFGPFFAVVLLVVVVVGPCVALSFTVGTRNIDEIKAAAPQVIKDWGFKIVGYEGYKHGVLVGGHVWYILKREGPYENPNTIYTARIYKWGDEYHLGHMRALNAVEGK